VSFWRIIFKGTEIEEMERDGVDWLKFVQDTGQWRYFQSDVESSYSIKVYYG
jgi:hypothetical protein